MRLFARSLTLLAALAGGGVASQAPEFAQQYRQRLGGAADELARVVAAFDADAAASGLGRREALETYVRAPNAFLNDRGKTMGEHIARLARLERQRIQLDAAPPLSRPGIVLQDADPELVRATLASFEPALPLTEAGAVYGGLGAGTGLLLTGAGFSGFGRLSGRRRRARHSARQ